MQQKILVKNIGITNYEEVFANMKNFTESRNETNLDEIWVTQHNPVFTQGQAGKKEHILTKTDIPIVQSNRGGQVTYHGIGQVVIYPLINIRRRNIGVRQMVTLLENTVVEFLKNNKILAQADPKAPGVYVDGEKIAALGLRVRKGCVYHGLALNVNLDLAPFNFINPCGYAGMKVTSLEKLGLDLPCEFVENKLVELLINNLNQITKVTKTI